MSAADVATRRGILRRIRKVLAPFMVPLEAGGVGYLFTSQTNPDGPTPAHRAARSIRFRALPGTDGTFCGFLPDGVVTDYMAGSLVVESWRGMRTGVLRGLLRVAEAEARAEPVRRQRASARAARADAKINGPAAVARRERLLARAAAGRVPLRGDLAHSTGMQLVAAGLGRVFRPHGDETSYFEAVVST